MGSWDIVYGNKECIIVFVLLWVFEGCVVWVCVIREYLVD